MRLVEEEREEMLEEKVEEEEEEREVITVREALVLSISSEYKLTTNYEWGLDSQEHKQSEEHKDKTTQIVRSTSI